MQVTTDNTSAGKAAILSARNKPPVAPIDPANIHDGLKLFDRWLGWRWVRNDKTRKWGKVPTNARTGGAGSSTDPATWGRFDEALAAVQAGRADGIGFVLGEADGGVHFSGIDLDDCRDLTTGELSDLARDIIGAVGTYCEVSPTGTGVKLFCIGKLPAGARTKNKAGTVEVYSGGRFFCVTGQRVNGTPKRSEARQEQLTAVWQRYIGAEQRQPIAARPSSSNDAPTNGHASEAALAAMLRIRPGANEHDGSNRLHAVCCRAVEHNLPDAAAVATIRQYEAQYPFPSAWTDADILRRLRDAEGKAERGSAVATPTRHLTDVGNAERFADQHGADVRYCHPWGKWLTWDGRRWAIDASGEVVRRAKLTARSIYAEAARAVDDQERKALAAWAAASERRERLAAMIALSESEQPIPIAVETLDADPWLLNCENGSIDLRTGELREHRRADYLTKCAPVEYLSEVGDDPELWLSFLDRIFDGRAKLIQFLQRLMGASLVGEVLEHVLPILYGTGANGKSVLVTTWCDMLGTDYALKAPHGFLIAKRTESHPTELADLHGKRLVAAVETADGGRLSEVLVKELTGGDSIRARRMREDFWQFKPTHTVVLSTNHRPTIYGTDYAIWRRIRLVPFTVTIPESEQDKELTNKLRAEWPGIFRWAVAGCLAWQRDGLQAPSDVLVATEAYRADMDVLGEWLAERCVTARECEARAADLYHDYKRWSEGRGEFVQTQTRFGTRLGERGFVKARDSGNRVVYRGVGLLPEGPDSSEAF